MIKKQQVRCLRITDADNVGIAIESLSKGEFICMDGLPPFYLQENIPEGHKFALSSINSGETIIKYGVAVGRASLPIKCGEWVCSRNMVTNLSGINEYEYNPTPEIFAPIALEDRIFKGYRRKNGLVGIRNELWIIPTVGCVNGVAEQLAQLSRVEKPDYVDAVLAYPHNYGCSQLGEDHENTRKILRNMALHPNAGGVLLIGLGCENNQMSALLESLGDFDTKRIKFMECQKVKDEIGAGMALLRELFLAMAEDKREDSPFSKLRVGLKCGGSDGFSGITANPLVGQFSDFLVSQGGSAVLTEVPEMFGAETLLMNRCLNRHIFEKTVALINDFKHYFITNNQPIYENPSPGNKEGGITTLEEKSVGCTQKSGNSPIVDVLAYGDYIKVPGLSLLSAPGNDLVATTALAASGCQIILFTTGRGTPFGSFVPTCKISTNTNLYEKKRSWIDFDAGALLYGVKQEQLYNDLIEKVLEIANGSFTCNEKNGYRELAVFKTGVTL